MINIIVASHGPLARALLESAGMVYGQLPGVFTVTLDDERGIDGFKHAFAQVMTQAGQDADGVLVLCDMQSGTPWNVACQYGFSAEVTPPVAVIGGVNFPMLLQVEDIREQQDVHQAAAQLLELTLPTLVIAAPASTTQSDDF